MEAACNIVLLLWSRIIMSHGSLVHIQFRTNYSFVLNYFGRQEETVKNNCWLKFVCDQTALQPLKQFTARINGVLKWNRVDAHWKSLVRRSAWQISNPCDCSCEQQKVRIECWALPASHPVPSVISQLGKYFPLCPAGLAGWWRGWSSGAEPCHPGREGCPAQLGNRVTQLLQSSVAILIIVACLQRVYKRFFLPCFCCCPCSNGEVGQLPECHPAPLLCGVHSEVKNEEQKLKLRSLQVHCKQIYRAI